MIKISHFSDAQQHGDAIRGWRNHYYQLTPGKLDSSLAEVVVADMHVFREHFSHEVAQFGTSPTGAISFALPGIDAEPPKPADGRANCSLYAISNGAEFTLHVGSGADTLVLVVDAREWWDAVQAAHPTQSPRQYPGGLVRCDTQAYPYATRRLRQQFEAAMTSPLMSDVPAVQKVFRDSMLCTLLDLRPGETDRRGDFLGQAVRADVVRRSRDLVLGAGGEPVTVLDICRACRLSRRAIQTIFLRETGVTPLVYLRAIRLNEVRIQLMSSARDDLAIGDLAARFGFYHLSHFAADYRSLFGELPSETPRRAAAARDLRRPNARQYLS
jgi:AraC family ethanolamine operon transcriptional activator